MRQRPPDQTVLRLALTVFFWVLLGASLVLYGFLWFATPADIAAARSFRQASRCGDGNGRACYTSLRGTLVARREIRVQRSQVADEVTVRSNDESREPFTGQVHTRGGRLLDLRPGETVQLRYYGGTLTDVIASEGHFETNANPSQQAHQDESLVDVLEWVVPIPLVPVGAFLLLTRRRRRPGLY